MESNITRAAATLICRDVPNGYKTSYIKKGERKES